MQILIFVLHRPELPLELGYRLVLHSFHLPSDLLGTLLRLRLRDLLLVQDD